MNFYNHLRTRVSFMRVQMTSASDARGCLPSTECTYWPTGHYCLVADPREKYEFKYHKRMKYTVDMHSVQSACRVVDVMKREHGPHISPNQWYVWSPCKASVMTYREINIVHGSCAKYTSVGASQGCKRKLETKKEQKSFKLIRLVVEHILNYFTAKLLLNPSQKSQTRTFLCNWIYNTSWSNLEKVSSLSKKTHPVADILQLVSCYQRHAEILCF